MNNEDGYKTLEEVHKAYTDWEQQKKAWYFGLELWNTAQKLIGDDIDEDLDFLIGEEEQVNKIFETLHQEGSLTLPVKSPCFSLWDVDGI